MFYSTRRIPSLHVCRKNEIRLKCDGKYHDGSKNKHSWKKETRITMTMNKRETSSSVFIPSPEQYLGSINKFNERQSPSRNLISCSFAAYTTCCAQWFSTPSSRTRFHWRSQRHGDFKINFPELFSSPPAPLSPSKFLQARTRFRRSAINRGC